VVDVEAERPAGLDARILTAALGANELLRGSNVSLGIIAALAYRRRVIAVDEQTAADAAEELCEILEDVNAALRIVLDRFDPPAPGPRERHLRLVVDSEA
jgi:hypothetical protein